MGRTVTTPLQNLLDLESCNTQTTVDLQFTDNAYDINVATDDFTVDATPDRDYVSDLRHADDLKQSVFSPPDRVNISIQNVDKDFGAWVQDEVFAKSTAIVGRYYTDPRGTLPAVWVELFRGEARPTGMDEAAVNIEVLHDLAAAGYCVADWSLTENCQFKFKQTDTCGYAGVLTTCNKRRKSPAGCSGRANEFAFGGMEFPEPQVPSVPTSGDPDPDPPHTCPRIDQYVPMMGTHGEIVARTVQTVREGEWLFNPLTDDFHRIKRAFVVKNQPIWSVSSSMGVTGYSSPTHPLIPFRMHPTGVAVSKTKEGDSLLLWQLNDRKMLNHAISRVFDTGELGDVMFIEMEDGHVYAYGDDEELFIVCHNAKPAE